MEIQAWEIQALEKRAWCKSLGFASLFTLCAATSAFAASTQNVEFTGSVTADQLVKRFCEITVQNNGTLKINDVSSVYDEAARHLSGTGKAGSGDKARVNVVHSGTVHIEGVEMHLTATNPTLTRNGESYDNMSYSFSGFGDFPGLDEGGFAVSGAVTSVNLNTSLGQQSEPFDVWFFAEMSGAEGDVFPPGEYVGTTTITCHPGKAPVEEPEVEE